MALILHQRSLFLLKNMISCNMYHIVPSVLKPTKYFFFCVKCIYTKLDTNVCRFQAEKLCTILDLCQTLSSWVWPASLTDQYRGSINYPSLTEISVCVVCGEIPGSQQLQFQKLIKKCYSPNTNKVLSIKQWDIESLSSILKTFHQTKHKHKQTKTQTNKTQTKTYGNRCITEICSVFTLIHMSLSLIIR